MSAADVTVYGFGLDQTRRASVQVAEGVRVEVVPTSRSDNDAALMWANQISAMAVGKLAEDTRVAALKRENEELRAQVRRLEGRMTDLWEINEAAIKGRRRFFSEVVARPVHSGKWDAEVWLLDPVKLENGRGLRFESLDEVRRLHPELWVRGVTPAGDLILDAWGDVE